MSNSQQQQYVYVVNATFADEELSVHKTRKGAIRFAEQYMTDDLFDDRIGHDTTLNEIKVLDQRDLVEWVLHSIVVSVSKKELKE